MREKRQNSPRRRVVLAALLLPVVILAVGCGYTLRSPFDATIRTVYVPVFKSVSFRRDLNLQLTEFVQKEIEHRSGFKVVGNESEADTMLEGEVQFVDKNVMVVNPDNLPRELMGMVTVKVRWVDLRSKDPAARNVPYTTVIENLPFFPEVGETTSLAFQRTLQRIAQDIVNMMELPW